MSGGGGRVGVEGVGEVGGGDSHGHMTIET